MLSEKQTEEIKEKLIQQIEANFPEDKREIAKQQVLSMNGSQLEQFLKQNNLMRTKKAESPAQNIFRSIIDKEIDFYKIEETKYALAILEINPISRGHIIIIPKKPALFLHKIPQPVFSLAKKISKRIKSKLKPREVSVFTSHVAGEFIVNVVPIYKDESMNSQRYKAEEKELKMIQEKLEKKTKKKIPKKIIKKSKKQEPPVNLRLPKRFP